MKKIEEIIEILDKKKPYLREKYKINSLSIFGSYSRNVANAGSDIDILVTFEQTPGLEFVDLAEELEEILGLNVDLVSRDGVKREYLKEIEKDLMHV